MSGPSPEQLSAWLFDSMCEESMEEFIPRENLKIICDRAVNFFYSDGTLMAEGIINWLSAEYGAPPDLLTRQFNEIAAKSGEIGIKVEMPGDEDDIVEPPVGGEEEVSGSEEAAESPSAPAAPEGPRVPPKARPKRSWQMLPPKPRDPAKNLAAFLQDTAYFEFAALDYAYDGEARKEARVASLLEAECKLSNKEKSVLAASPVEPGKDEDSLEGWILRVNGLALAYAYALALSREDAIPNTAEWLRAIRMIDGVVGEITSKITAKNIEAKKQGGDMAGAFDSAWRRMQSVRQSLDKEFKKRNELVFGKGPSQSAAPPAKGKKPPKPAKATPKAAPVSAGESKGARAFVNEHQTKFIIGAVVVLALCVAFALYSSGIFKSSGIEEISVDLSPAGLSPTKALTDGNVLVVVVDAGAWNNFDEEKKKESLKSVYQIAKGIGMEQAQIRDASGKAMAHIWSPDRLALF